MAVMGGSISTWGRQPGLCDQTWHGMLHRWLELTFSPCGDLVGPEYSVRERDRQYNGTFGFRSTCNQSTIEYVDLSLGSSSSIWAEKCLLGPDSVRGTAALPFCPRPLSPALLPCPEQSYHAR